MSHFVEIELEMTGDPEDVVRALLDVGPARGQHKWTRDDIRVYDVRQPLYGHLGDQREERAHIIIRGLGGHKALGVDNRVGLASNDIGFEKNAAGKWVARISKNEVGSGYSSDWQKRVLSRWAVHRVGREAEARGYAWREETRDVGGKQYVFVHVNRR